MSLSPAQKFQRWVEAPLAALRSLPNGDGAFAALTIACGLYERFIDSTLHRQGSPATPEAFKTTAAADLACDPAAFDRFWNGYRLGLAHAFHPKQYVEKRGKGDSWGWEMAEAPGFEKHPTTLQLSDNVFIVRIDPWKFLDHVLLRWREHPDIYDELPEFTSGRVERIQSSPPNASTFPERSEYRTVSDLHVPPATGSHPALPR